MLGLRDSPKDLLAQIRSLAAQRLTAQQRTFLASALPSPSSLPDDDDEL